MKVRKIRSLLVYFAFVGPGLLVYLFIVTYPIFYSLWLSVSDFNPNKGGVAHFVGLTHYIKMFQDPLFWHSLKNNLIVVGVSVFGQIPIGFILAYILFRKMVRGENFFQAMVFLPNFLAPVVIGVLWRQLITADGPVSRIIQMTTGDPSAQFEMMLRVETVMIPIGVALIWMYTGLYMIIFLANLQKIDISMVEAAQIDGATEPQIFLKVIVPILSGAVLVCTILAIAGSLRGFDLIFAMTTRGLTRRNAMVLPIYMYVMAFDNYTEPLRFAIGGAIANVIVLISVCLILISNFIEKRLRPREES